MRKLVVAVATVVAIAVIVALVLHIAWSTRGGGEIVVCAAGSLSRPLHDIAARFQSAYGVKVLLETAGSVKITRMITELGKRCDVVMLADYRLIPLYLEPRYARWYAIFASNTMVIAFTKSSRFAEEMEKHPSEWFEILARPGVRFAFSNPNKDPCGYRAVGVIALASIYYHNRSIIGDLLLKNLKGVRASFSNHSVVVWVYPSISPTSSKIVIRPKSIELLALLESHDIDYAFLYRSEAVEQNLSYIELPPQINLGNPSMDKYYSRAVVHILSGTSFEKAIPMKSIAYGLTIPTNAQHPALAIKFLEFVLTKGVSILKREGFEPVSPPKCFGDVPPSLRGLCSGAG